MVSQKHLLLPSLNLLIVLLMVIESLLM
jgi:hypothetical protein